MNAELSGVDNTPHFTKATEYRITNQWNDDDRKKCLDLLMRLRPKPELPVDSIKDYIANTTPEQRQKDWEEIKKDNENLEFPWLSK